MTPTKLPIQDGDIIKPRGIEEKVAGEIKPPHTEPICYTLQGNWYRRSDGVEMTGAGGEIMTVQEFYRRRATGKL